MVSVKNEETKELGEARRYFFLDAIDSYRKETSYNVSVVALDAASIRRKHVNDQTFRICKYAMKDNA